VTDRRKQEKTKEEEEEMFLGKAEFSVKFFVASVLIFVAGLFTLTSFAMPYWSQSYPSTGNEFKNIGLWEGCFNRYRHWKDDNQKPYTGCFWFWSPDMIRFRDWIMPPWFIAVQFFACFGLIFEFVVLAFLSVAFITNIRFKFYFVFPITILTFVSHVMHFLALLVYGINGDNREWMPRPEFNVYSWSYWFELVAAFFLLNASILLLLESRTLYEVYKKNTKIKKQYDGFQLNSTMHLNMNTTMSNGGSQAGYA